MSAPGGLDAWTGRFAVLGDPTRLALLIHIHHAGRIRVRDLAERVDLQEATVSKALALLRHHEIVVGERERRSVFYRLVDPAVHRLLHQVTSTAATSRRVVEESHGS